MRDLRGVFHKILTMSQSVAPLIYPCGRTHGRKDERGRTHEREERKRGRMSRRLCGRRDGRLRRGRTRKDGRMRTPTHHATERAQAVNGASAKTDSATECEIRASARVQSAECRSARHGR